jgi:hypothetical protein
MRKEDYNVEEGRLQCRGRKTTMSRIHDLQGGGSSAQYPPRLYQKLEDHGEAIDEVKTA